MYDPRPPRTVSAGLSAGLTALFVALLIYGLRAAPPRELEGPSLVSLSLGAPPIPTPEPTERPEKPDAAKAAPKDEAGQRNRRNEATQVVAPPVQPLIILPPVIVAPQPGLGAAEQSGASELDGTGQGAGNRGEGRGGGGTGGDGTGTGGGEAVVGPRRIAGRLSFEDLPVSVMAEGGEATVRVVYAVRADGLVEDCAIERSGGVEEIDSLTCRLIEQRFRFRPARDARGRAVRALVGEAHTWVVRPPPPQKR